MKYFFVLSALCTISFTFADSLDSRFNRHLEPILLNTHLNLTAYRMEKHTPEEIAADPTLIPVPLARGYSLSIFTCKDDSVPDEQCLLINKINSKKITQQKTLPLAVQTLLHPPIIPTGTGVPTVTEDYSHVRIVLNKSDSKNSARYKSDILELTKQAFLDPHRATFFLTLEDETFAIVLEAKPNKAIKAKKMRQTLAITSPEYAVYEATKTLSLETNIKELFLKDAGVSEGYSIKEHVMRISSHYEAQKRCWIDAPFKERLLKQNINIDALFPVLLALHDIGKPLAVEENCKANQHDFTIPIQTQQLTNLKFTQAEIDLAAALVDHDYIGEYLQNLNPLLNTLVGLKIQSGKTVLNKEDFYKLQILFFTLDSSSYPSLETQIFTRDEKDCLQLNPEMMGILETSFLN